MSIVVTRCAPRARTLPQVSIVDRVAAAGVAAPIEEARIIVAGGRGIGGADGFKIVEDLAEALGGAVGAAGLVLSVLVALVVAVIIFQFATKGVMLKPLNVTNIFLQNGYIVLMALGMLLIIVVGHIDLSVGSVAAFTGAVAAVLMVNQHMDPIVASLAALGIGAMIGMWQLIGFYLTWLRLPGRGVCAHEMDKDVVQRGAALLEPAQRQALRGAPL